MSNVPQIQFTATGPVVPTAAQILAGVQADMNAAFGGDLNANLNTPQGQLASSYAAMISVCYGALAYISNNTDPAFASGRFQDAIGRFYNISRNPPVSTSIQVTCAGLTGVVIPVGAQVSDVLGNIYSCTQTGTIPAIGSITLPFANNVAGAIAVPSSVSIYQTISGWDSATFVSGAIGSAVESQYAFETRRQATLSVNSNNQNQAVLGAILILPNIQSAYVRDNVLNYPVAANPATTITGYISGTSLTVSSGTGAAIGQAVSGVGVLNGTVITGGVTSPFTVNQAQTVGSVGTPITLQLGGVSINANSLYVCVSGGLSASIAQAIWMKKAAGCGTTGSTSQTVYDTSTVYGSPGIPYTINYQTATNAPVFFVVNIKNSSLVPAGAAGLIQQAIVNAFAGTDGGLPAQIGQVLVSSRYNAGILALGSWAQLLSVQMVSSLTTSPTAVFTASIAAAVMTVTAFTSGSGTLAIGMGLVGVNVVPGTYIVNQLTGTAGQTGTYTVSNSQTAGSAVVNGLLVNNFQQQMLINQMPTTSSAFIQVNLI